MVSCNVRGVAMVYTLCNAWSSLSAPGLSTSSLAGDSVSVVLCRTAVPVPVPGYKTGGCTSTSCTFHAEFGREGANINFGNNTVNEF